MANDTKATATAFTDANLDKAIRQVQMKLARQKLAISESEAHLAALRELQKVSK